jgi:hypothetical protein
MFQSPKGDSGLCYEDTGNWVKPGGMMLQSPEGDSLFFYYIDSNTATQLSIDGFQSPEGDSLFFYQRLG